MLYNVPMYIESVPNRNSPPCILLRESYREGGKVKKRTLANVSAWPPEIVTGLRLLLKGGSVVEQSVEDLVEVTRSLPHGHVAAVLGTLYTLQLDRMIAATPCPERLLVVAMIVARIIAPRSKLATARGLGHDTLASSLAEALGLGDVDVSDLYAAMDWLNGRQGRIEQKLAKKHLTHGTLVLYDVTSTYFEGDQCALAARGYNRDKKKGKVQIVCGLLCNKEGCPIAIEVFEGNTGDPSTLSSQIQKVRDQFALHEVVFVGDRGMLTSARIQEEFSSVKGLDWVSCLKATQIRKLLDAEAFQLSIFDESDMSEITSPDYPNERLVVCRNSMLAAKREKVREELLKATEKELSKIVHATKRTRQRLIGKDAIGIRVGKIINKFKMGKHFIYEMSEESFSYHRDTKSIDKEKELDGIYVIRTSVSSARLSTDETVYAYKSLSQVERAFRSCKTMDLKMRPIYHYLPHRVKAHIFLCMLAYYVEWHMRQSLAPMLFDDEDKENAQSFRSSPVATATVSPTAKKKAQRKITEDGLPVHSFQTLLDDLATITKNYLQPKIADSPIFTKLTRPTPVQRKAFELLGLTL
jgi:transposase